MKFCTYVKLRNITLTIIAPFVILYFSGLIGIRNFYTWTWELHDKAKKENKTNILYTKKCIALYLRVVLSSLINIAAWILTIYFLTK